MTPVEVSHWPADTADSVLETTVGSVLRYWIFVDEFPLTGSGKIKKYTLRERWEKGEFRLAGAPSAAGERLPR